MDEANIKGVILIQDEPLFSVLGKWISWMLILVLTLIILIYFSNTAVKKSYAEDCVNNVLV
jgi:hypothetical protein